MATNRSLPRYFLTIGLVLFLICGFTVTPIAGAELSGDSYEESSDESVDNNPAVAVPAVAVICIGSSDAVLIASSVLITIAGFLGLFWDEAHSWDDFVSDAEDAISDLLQKKEWVLVSSDKGQATVKSICEQYCPSGGGPKGKKNDKWYFEARLVNYKDGKGKQLEINTAEDQLLTEDEAIREMGRGKEILALTKEMAKNLIGRFKHLTKEQIDNLAFEGDHIPEMGKLNHLHFEAKGMDHRHLWSWE